MARPKFETRPTPRVKLAQKPLLDALDWFGFVPMGWQRKAIRLLGELRPPSEAELEQFGPIVKGGVPRYRQVIVTVPRQSGKSTVAQAFIKARGEGRPSQRLYGTSKSRDDARLWQAELNLLLPEVHYTSAAGRETITWDNGSTYAIFAPNKKGGHGASADAVLLDEAWTITSEVLQGIIPAMAARPLSQMLFCSSMGDLESTVWNGLVEAGRAATEDPGASIAYLEYSAAHEDDVFNPELWHKWMPALGISQSRESVRADMALMEADPDEGLSGIVRAYGNITTTTRRALFPQEWLAKAWTAITPEERIVLAVDVNENPAGASVVSGHLTEDGKGAVRLIEWNPGSPEWVIATLEEIIAIRKVEGIAADLTGPAKQIHAELAAFCDRNLIRFNDRHHLLFGGDCARFYDNLRQEQILLDESWALHQSVTAAQKRTLGDLWVISRRQTTADASPVIAAIIANGLAHELAVVPRARYAIH